MFAERKTVTVEPERVTLSHTRWWFYPEDAMVRRFLDRQGPLLAAQCVAACGALRRPSGWLDSGGWGQDADGLYAFLLELLTAHAREWQRLQSLLLLTENPLTETRVVVLLTLAAEFWDGRRRSPWWSWVPGGTEPFKWRGRVWRFALPSWALWTLAKSMERAYGDELSAAAGRDRFLMVNPRAVVACQTCRLMQTGEEDDWQEQEDQEELEDQEEQEEPEGLQDRCAVHRGWLLPLRKAKAGGLAILGGQTAAALVGNDATLPQDSHSSVLQHAADCNALVAEGQVEALVGAYFSLVVATQASLGQPIRGLRVQADVPAAVTAWGSLSRQLPLGAVMATFATASGRTLRAPISAGAVGMQLQWARHTLQPTPECRGDHQLRLSDGRWVPRDAPEFSQLRAEDESFQRNAAIRRLPELPRMAKRVLMTLPPAAAAASVQMGLLARKQGCLQSFGAMLTAETEESRQQLRLQLQQRLQ